MAQHRSTRCWILLFRALENDKQPWQQMRRRRLTSPEALVAEKRDAICLVLWRTRSQYAWAVILYIWAFIGKPQSLKYQTVGATSFFPSCNQPGYWAE